MKFLLLCLSVLFFSCTEKKRDFFLSMKDKNYFLDTFRITNLKNFGISDKAISKLGIDYFKLNGLQNSIYIEGYLSNNNNRIFFTPENSERELLLFDPSNNSNPVFQTETSKSKTIYEIINLGKTFDPVLKDSIMLSKITINNVLNTNETLLIRANKKLELLEIDHINCRNDTLVMNFFPTQKVFYKNINKSAVCL